MIQNRLRYMALPFVMAAAFALLANGAHADLYIRDDLNDTGIEPNPNNGAMWTSPDIWVRNTPMPGWNPRPYPSASPPAWVDATHFDPDYRSPLSGQPNYVYVRVRNKGSASAGTERLLLYWASASTGLGWDPAKVAGSFIDKVQNGVLFGGEITKVRKNAATASQAERDAYVNALRKIATDPALSFALQGGLSYWQTQQEIHRFGPTYRHGFNGGNAWVPSVAFLPWHREFINRYEGLLQEADPTVKLLYWPWTQNPTQAPFDYTAMMGAFGGGSPPSAVSIGPPLLPDLNAAYPIWGAGSGGTVTPRRRLQGNGTPLAQSDATVVGRVPYDQAGAANSAFSGGLESFSHNSSHVYIASTPNIPNNNTTANLLTAGDQLFQPYAARDPFFFMLHTKVDELWARWQRKSLNNLDPATTFGTAAGNASIVSTMGPWDGTGFPDGLPNDLPAGQPEIEPWTPAGGQLYAKRNDDRSVTSPPFYDTAPLTIPALQPGEEMIVEIPWYPPNPVSFGNVNQPNHVCLLARIETSVASPFGMTVAETTDINFNTRQNNNIAWKNVSIVDSFPGPFKIVKFLLANNFKESIRAGIRFGAKLNATGREFFELGTLRADLGNDLMARWRANGGQGRGLAAAANGQLRLTAADAVLDGIDLKPGEVIPVQLTFDLNADYKPTRRGETIVYDVVQTGTPGDPAAVVGGQRYMVAVDKLAPVQQGRVWRWLKGTKAPPERWRAVEFDDSSWMERRLDLGWVEATGADSHGASTATYYFRHGFDVDDPAFFRNLTMRIKRSDGIVVYLNEKEVHRANLADGAVGPRTFARAPATRLEGDVYFPVTVDQGLLRKGRNVIAVEIHRAEANRGDLTFDLALDANADPAPVAPKVRFANVVEGGLLTIGRTTTFDVDALKLAGTIRSVTLMVDGKAVQTLERPPFSFKWKVLAGPHRLTAVVNDSDGMTTREFGTVTGVANVPPTVSLTQPAQHMTIAEGDAVVVLARAADSDGRVTRVEFYVHDSFIIGSPGRLAGTATRAPYTFTLSNLKQGHAMIVAVAFDDGGARTASIPIMVHVQPKRAAPR